MIKCLTKQAFIPKVIMGKIKYLILDSINKIRRQDWDRLFGEIPEGYDFFKTLEESWLEDFSFYYVQVSHDQDVLLIAPFFIADFQLDIAAEGVLQRTIKRIRKHFPRFLILKTLFCGSPFGENGILGIHPGLKENKKKIIAELLIAVRKIRKKNNVSFVMFKDFLESDCPLLDNLAKKGFFAVKSFPSVTLPLPFGSLDQYLQTLSRNTRKDLRRKVEKVKNSQAIQVKVTDNIKDIAKDIYRLYLNTYNAGTVKFEKLSPEFFLKVSEYMPQETRFFLYYLNEKLVAFNLCFAHKDTLIDKFIGFDYAAAYKYNLYFFSWCYNIQWCLENSITYYQVGQTDYHPKIKLGGKLVPLYAYIKHYNPFVNSLLRLCAKILVPKDFNQYAKND